MKKSSEISHRKSDHIEINLQEDVKSSNTTGLEKFRLVHSALPEIDFDMIDPSVELFGKKISFPLQISSMTGGTRRAAEFNRIFAESAEKFHIAIGVGSQRIGIDNPAKMASFQIRKYAPTTLIFANLGAVQLNYGYSYKECNNAVEKISADALILHLNPLQEVIMDEGNTNFSNLLNKIENICKKINVPVIVKEVGWGINSKIAKSLFNAGVSAVDIAGSGGTSWSEVEKFRSDKSFSRTVASGFKDWGIKTTDAIIAVNQLENKKLIFASGGLSSGVDILKCLALGANLCGIARPFLLKAAESQENLDTYIQVLKKQFEIAMFSIGIKSVSDISRNHIVQI